MIECKECDSDLVQEDDTELELESIVDCEDCGTQYVVTGINPIVLSEVAEDQEDDDDEDDEEDEDIA